MVTEVRGKDGIQGGAGGGGMGMGREGEDVGVRKTETLKLIEYND